MPLGGQIQPKARGKGGLGDAVHRDQPSRAKIREEKGREENLLVMMESANRELQAQVLFKEPKVKANYA